MATRIHPSQPAWLRLGCDHRSQPVTWTPSSGCWPLS